MIRLAETLGETWHVSPLARKFRRLGLPTLESWMQLAVQRGCTHYRNGMDPVLDPGKEQISNAELAVALLLGENETNTRAIRLAGQLMGGETSTGELVKLGTMERVLRRIRYIAERGREVEPEVPLWQELCRKLPPDGYPSGLLPHRDRFTTQSPVRRGKLGEPPALNWLRA